MKIAAWILIALGALPGFFLLAAEYARRRSRGDPARVSPIQNLSQIPT